MQMEKVLDPSATPSARLLEAMAERETSFFEFARDLSRGYRTYFLELPPIAPELLARLERETEESHRRQREIEAADDIPFEEFVRRYYAG
jgi:glutamate--cysteine ligase